MPLISKCVDDFKHYVICLDAIIGKYMLHGNQYWPFCHAWQTSRQWPLGLILPKVHEFTIVILCRSESVIQFIYLRMLRQISCCNMRKIMTLSDNDFPRRRDMCFYKIWIRASSCNGSLAISLMSEDKECLISETVTKSFQVEQLMGPSH